ncbi:flagellar hook-basal body complex protein FliE [Aneurinibacillus soli]|uniref:Flagellar hook-basal body complex protein FliE n=1 Tax=Aneurinibacillus soli TaxID=1500254 RepID=A0A0U5AVA2_9BACL|nr:flagellar hook-basal body complex protein FliE [Aneurinibacillus soli]PYE63403.1 flagellar hook-basal body complex protein FliE [Aneurinibacillus soli]BAU27665.1 Flagellar hook-basal body complex protein FliE [Aneurinibacillus soli]
MIEKISMGLPTASVQGIAQTPTPTPNEVTESFASYLRDAINDVNGLQKTADKMNEGLATGQVQDFHQVAIASQKASIALEMTMQVRNKAVEAYQEIMRMQI